MVSRVAHWICDAQSAVEKSVVLMPCQRVSLRHLFEPRPYLSGYFIIRVTKVRGPRSSGSEFRGEHAPLLDTDDSEATGKYLRVRDSNGK